MLMEMMHQSYVEATPEEAETICLPRVVVWSGSQKSVLKAYNLLRNKSIE
jgi:hypothetical protein